MTRNPCAIASLAALFFIAGCSSEKSEIKPAEEKKTEAAKEAEPAKPAEKVIMVKLETSKGNVMVEVHPDWAPIGAKQFLDLVNDKFFDGARFFRVVPNFVVQFGIAADPAKHKKWNKAIKDDPVLRTNSTGTIAFATSGPNTRTSQLFVNLRSNQMLDSQGFAPFARVTEGMALIDGVWAGYGERPEQDKIERLGNKYLDAEFPKLDFVKKAVIVETAAGK